eukprot:6178529-Pyramimonas_sp.AAC.1
MVSACLYAAVPVQHIEQRALGEVLSSKWYQASGIKQVLSSKCYQASGIKQVVSSKWYQASGIKQAQCRHIGLYSSACLYMGYVSGVLSATLPLLAQEDP